MKLMVIVWAANLALVAGIVGIFLVLKGGLGEFGIGFPLGALFGATVYQVSHRLAYGSWF